VVGYAPRGLPTLLLSSVIKETSQGDAAISSQRLAILRNFLLLDLNQSVLDLAEQFLGRSNLPAKADVDAVHIAAATVHGMDYLLIPIRSSKRNSHMRKVSHRSDLIG
jgi:hypothetical protein